MTNDFYKTAHEHFDFLLDQYKEKLNSEEIEKVAFEVINRMIHNGQISTPEEAIIKVAEYKQKALDDLKIIDKALDLGPVEKTAEIFTAPELGSLSDTPSAESQDNLTSFLLEDY